MGPEKFTQHMDNCYNAFASLENFFCKPLELLYSHGSECLSQSSI